MKNLRLLAGSALVALGLASAASAEVTAVTSYNYMSIDMAGTDFDASGLTLDLDGDYAGGFQWDATLGYAHEDSFSIGAHGATVGAAWHYNDVVGPAARYAYIDLGPIDGDVFMVGLSGEYAMNDVTFEGELVSDVDNFGDTNLLSLGVDFDYSDRMVLTADVDHLAADGVDDTTLVNFGVEYDVTNTAYVKAGVTAGEVGGFDAKGVNLGVGFNF
ncbi:MAG: hypothetical protein ABJN42_07485 [Roseibium sp.]|uniref:hypothetical protein n=1 Tax=Roseibium sp. TaxID=1936156 RepID=UPI003299CE0B